MTRAKAAALGADELSVPAKALQTKRTAMNSQAQGTQRKRAALGDVSNVTKAEGAENKKPAAKGGLVSKAAHPTGVTKSTRPSTRPALTAKDSKRNADVRRAAAPRAGAIGVQKRKVPATTTSTTDSARAGSQEPSLKKVHTSEVEKRLRAEEKSEAFVSKRQPEPESESEPEPEPELRSTVYPEPSAAPRNGYPEGVRDLDTEDLEDPLMVAEYANDIFEYLYDLEVKTIPNPNYMDHQDELEWKMRGILVDWLVEVHTRFHLLPETLFLAVNIVDRFLSEKVVQLDRLQLVGITALFIASKYEEVLSPHVSNFRHVADDGFSDKEILAAERFILSTLDYDLSYPNPMNFLRRISKADSYDVQSRTIGKYLMEICLLDHRFMLYRPSHVAAAAMYLTRLMLDRGEWVSIPGKTVAALTVHDANRRCQDETIAFYSGYTEEEIEPVVQLMVDYLARPICHDAFFKKYANKKFMKGM